MPSYPGGVGITIGIPWDGKPVCVEWAFGLQNLHTPTNFDVRWAFIKGRPVAEARTLIAEQAVKDKARYLFFLGTDVTVPAFAVRQMIFHLEHHPRYAICGGIYVHKSPPQEPLVYRGNGQGPYWDWKIGEVFDVDGIGMDATLIRVDALKDLPKPWFFTKDSVEAAYNGEPKAEFWTEDLWLCARMTDNCWKCRRDRKEHSVVDPADHEFQGWGVMADGGILCTHWDNSKGIPFELPQNSKPFRSVMKKGEKKVVDLGCGQLKDSYKTDEGEVLRVDWREDVNPDYRCDLRKLPFADNYFDIVFSSHTLEHFCPSEVGEVLDEWIRIMKKGGELRLILPNLEWAAQQIVNKEIDNNVWNVLYGAQTYEENFHKSGFTKETLELLLAQRGFKEFEWRFNGYHMLCRSWKEKPADVIPAELVGPNGDAKDTKLSDKDKQELFGKDKVPVEVFGEQVRELQKPDEVPVSVRSVHNVAEFVAQEQDASVKISYDKKETDGAA